MPSRNEEYFKHERAAFDADMSAARAAFEAGQLDEAVRLVVSPAHKFWYGKEPVRFKLLSDLYKLINCPVEEATYRETPWQGRLMAELYSVWPKVHLESAILKHSFPEPPSGEFAVSGAESVQLAASSWGVGWGAARPVALSRDKHWLKLWDLETGEIIRAEKQELELLAATIGRDSSHVLTGRVWNHSETQETSWSASFRETLRRIPTLRAGTHKKSDYQNVKYYKVSGEVVSYQRERTLEVNRETFDAHPIRGKVLPPRPFGEETPQSLAYLRISYTEDEIKEILERVELEREQEKQIVRVDQFETLTLAHEEIEGYLPAGTNAFVARSYEHGDLQVDDISYGDRITARLAVEDDDSWLEDIVAPGHGLKGMYGGLPTTPITALCLSSDGSLGLRNGNGATFGVWNMWTGDLLREFKGDADRVTCLCLSVDVSFAVSGSEDKTVRVWIPVSAECVRVLEGHEAAITAVCISLDATKILSADHDGIIKLWDRATGECLRTIQAHSQRISGLHITMDGKFAVSGSWDKTVKLWNLKDGSCMKTLDHTDWVTSVDMTPDGRYLVSSSYEGTKVWELLWRLEPHDVVAWDEGARPYLAILLNANAAWDGKLSTPVDMSREEIENTLRRQGPTWTAWHAPSKKDDWHRVWHLNWDINETLGHAGYGWLSEAGSEGSKIMDE